MHAETATITPDPRLIVIRQQPFNAEAPLHEHLGTITPNHLFYVRSNFTLPQLNAADWRLMVGGEVEHPYELTYDQLLALPSRSLLVTMECAGNGRANLAPLAEGEQWQYGAVSTAEWTGVTLGTILAAAGVTSSAREIVLTGADRGVAGGQEQPFARGLGLEQALHPDTLLAYAMNGEPLPVEHGFPLRLVVPGWYGMAAVKWVTSIAAIAGQFDGYYQVQRYVMPHPEHGERAMAPLTQMRTRSLITSLVEGATAPRGPHQVRGFAWSGTAPVTRVEVSVDGGATWREAEFTSEPQRYAWRRWEFRWDAATPGPATLRSRAFDAAAGTQPAEPEWNRLGYANNAIQTIAVTVE